MSATDQRGTAMRTARADAGSRVAAARAQGAGSAAVTGGRDPRAARPSRPAVRRVKLMVSRVDPWSAMKVGFLLSFAFGVAMVVMVFVLWTILSGMGVFDDINRMIGSILGDSDKPFDVNEYLGLGRILSLTIVLAVIDTFLWTALATLAAFLYNVIASLVGGLQLTLTDD